VHFNLATTAPEAYTSATLSGQIVAHGDSLYFLYHRRIFPEPNQMEYSGRYYIVYSNDYLMIRNLRLESGLQKINITSQREGPEQAIAVDISNLDLAQLALWRLAVYQPEGRISGTLTMDKFFTEMYITSNLKATNVKLASDTLGNVTLIGSYDGKKRLISLDPQTGIYNGNVSVTASGNMSFYKGVDEHIDGLIQLTNMAAIVEKSTFLHV